MFQTSAKFGFNFGKFRLRNIVNKTKSPGKAPNTDKLKAVLSVQKLQNGKAIETNLSFLYGRGGGLSAHGSNPDHGRMHFATLMSQGMPILH